MTDLSPGSDAPNLPSLANGILGDYNLTPAAREQLLSAGLPLTTHGQADPFDVCNWLTDNHLTLVPSLEKRWRGFRQHFLPWLAQKQGQSRIHWHSQRRLYVPPDYQKQQVHWQLPLPASTPRQTVSPHNVSETHQVQANQDIRRSFTVQVHPIDSAVPSEVEQLFTDWCEAFRYGYRRHSHTELPGGEPAGSCLDAALGLVRVLGEHGYTAKLEGGLLAAGWLSNPHYWVQVQIDHDQWAPLDPALPAIWRHSHASANETEAIMQRACGSIDSRRITVASVNDDWSGFVGWPVVLADGTDQQPRQAWGCQDWVLGQCQDQGYCA